jgi:hypothetical protein
MGSLVWSIRGVIDGRHLFVGVFAPTPLQNCSIPPPVPVDSSTGDLRDGSALANASDAALAKGNTVEEPTIRISWIRC